MRPPACLATLASASCAARSSVPSTSGCSGTGSPVVIDLRRDVVQGRPARHHRAERLRQRSALERLRPEGVHRPASLGQALARHLRRVAQVPVVVGRTGRRLAGGLELGDDPDQTLAQRVVDLRGHPLPLVQRAGLVGPG